MHQINMNIDVSKIDIGFLAKDITNEQKKEHQERTEAWAKVNLALPEEKRNARPQIRPEYMSGAEFVQHIVMKSVSAAKNSVNVETLRRTKALNDAFTDAIGTKGGIAELTDEQYKYAKSSLAKAEGWGNTPEIATAIIIVSDAINKGEQEFEIQKS